LDRKACDNNPNFRNDTAVSLPRNIRIEGNTFNNNNTGTVAGIARWLGLRDNTFTNNYLNWQVLGNDTGGTVFIDQCMDTVQVHNNYLTGPSPSALTKGASGLELWGRNIDAAGNTILSYPGDGIDANSAFNTTIRNNTTQNNGTWSATGGILVWTSGPGGPCDPIPRDTQSVTISANTSTGQAYGILLGDRGLSRNTINNLVPFPKV